MRKDSEALNYDGDNIVHEEEMKMMETRFVRMENARFGL